MSHEIWKEVPGYPMYEVSTHGRVKSWYNSGWGRRKEPRMLKTTPDIKGYPRVRLCENGVPETFKIHRLVLLTFVGPCPEDWEGCHNDGKPMNNHLENLRWDTRKGNSRDMFIHGTCHSMPGEKHPRSKLNESQVREIRRLYSTGKYTCKTLGNQFEVSSSLISYIINHKRWSHLA